MGKILSSMLFGVGLLLTSCGLYNDESSMPKEKVHYSSWRNWNNTWVTNRLEVIRQNGDKVIYLDDAFNDFKIDKFITIEDGITNLYRREFTDENFFERKQKEFYGHVRALSDDKRRQLLIDRGIR